MMIEWATRLTGIATKDPAIECNTLIAPLALNCSTRNTAPRVDSAIVQNCTIWTTIYTPSTATTSNTIHGEVILINNIVDNEFSEVEHRAKMGIY
jgi:hypothetical protein